MKKKLFEAWVAGLMVGAAVALTFYWQFREVKPKVIFCDVGQGDGTIVEEGGFQVVMDVGFDNGKMLRCLSEHLPLGDKEIEVLMISHWDNDHSGALARILEYYSIDTLVSSQEPKEKVDWETPLTILGQGDILRQGGMVFEVLSPESKGDISNDGSLVGVLSYGGKKIMFTGDASSKVEQKLVWRNVLNEKVDGLKVSHHGSAEGTSRELLEAIDPKIAVISVGKDNKFGHPNGEVLNRLKEARVEVHRTDNEGDVVLNL